MEFRIAPMLLICINFLLILFNLHQATMAVPTVMPSIKLLGIFLLIALMAISTFRSHDYFSKGFKAAFWTLLGLCTVGWGVLVWKWWMVE